MDKEKGIKFVIIDGNAIIHRAYHAIPPLTAKDGTMINAVYGFTSMLLKVLHDLKPTHLAVSFDVAGGTFRDKIFVGYKAKRVKADQDLYDQIPLVYEVVKAFGIQIHTKEGFEADDVIGTISEKISRLGLGSRQGLDKLQTIIVTGDMDLLQLVDGTTFVYGLRKGFSDVVMYDTAAVKERYGFGPERVVDYKSLRGDASDNIPGVKGIGEKTAKELIEKIGGVDEIYGEVKGQRSKVKSFFTASVIKKLEEDEKGAFMSKELATIKRDVPGLEFDLEKCKLVGFDKDIITKLFQKFEFYSLLKRVPFGPAGSAEAGVEHVVETPKKDNKKKPSKKVILLTKENFLDVFKKIFAAEKFVCRELFHGSDIFFGILEGLIFNVDGQSYQINFSSISIEQKKQIFSVFTDSKRILIGHDIKKFYKIMKLSGIEIKNKLFDLMIASYLINSSSRAHDLSELAMREVNIQSVQTSDQGSLFGVDTAVIAEEAWIISLIYPKLEPKLKNAGNIGLFEKIEMPLIPVLAEMELNGVAVDTKKMADLSKYAIKQIETITKQIWHEAGEEFNVASSVQLREILFDKMKLPVEGVKKGKTGLSTAQSELEKIRDLHPIIPMIEEHRELSKLQNTYIDVLPNLINKKTGRIHTTYNQAVAATGRLSSSDPNLQNIPIRTELGREIRDAFVAEPGFELVVADYSQIELRIVASLANDEKMIQIFKEGKDIHTATAAAINGVDLDKVTREMRYAAKEVNFGVLYGMGAFGLAWRAKISLVQAQEFIKKYFEQFSGVKKYIEQTLKLAHEVGYVETLFGRRRYVPELKASNFQLRSAGERMATNMPIQGTAADLMKMAMISVHESIKTLKHKNNDVRMILQVHDELVLEVKEGLGKEVSKMVSEIMEGVAQLRVPIEVHVSVGKVWGEMK